MVLDGVDFFVHDDLICFKYARLLKPDADCALDEGTSGRDCDEFGTGVLKRKLAGGGVLNSRLIFGVMGSAIWSSSSPMRSIEADFCRGLSCIVRGFA
jgi:hypothetical protein